jgi:hypothetical protein
MRSFLDDTRQEANLEVPDFASPLVRSTIAVVGDTGFEPVTSTLVATLGLEREIGS